MTQAAAAWGCYYHQVAVSIPKLPLQTATFVADEIVVAISKIAAAEITDP